MLVILAEPHRHPPTEHGTRQAKHRMYFSLRLAFIQEDGAASHSKMSSRIHFTGPERGTQCTREELQSHGRNSQPEALIHEYFFSSKSNCAFGSEFLVAYSFCCHTITRKLPCIGPRLTDSDSKQKRKPGLSWLLASYHSLNCATANRKHAGIIPKWKNTLAPALTLEVADTRVSAFMPLSVCMPTYQ